MARFRNVAAVLIVVGSALGAVSAQAQSAAPPAVNANVWNGKDHQPTAASEPPLSAKREKKVDHTLDKLDTQLESVKLPKTPAGAP